MEDYSWLANLGAVGIMTLAFLAMGIAMIYITKSLLNRSKTDIAPFDTIKSLIEENRTSRESSEIQLREQREIERKNREEQRALDIQRHEAIMQTQIDMHTSLQAMQQELPAVTTALENMLTRININTASISTIGTKVDVMDSTMSGYDQTLQQILSAITQLDNFLRQPGNIKAELCDDNRKTIEEFLAEIVKMNELLNKLIEQSDVNETENPQKAEQTKPKEGGKKEE